MRGSLIQESEARRLSRALDLYEARCGRFGETERRGALPGLSEIPVVDLDVRASGQAGRMAVKGHAAVFDRLSLDLGGFRERIAEGAFDPVLERNPHVLFNWDHDSRLLLGSTRGNDSDSLELSVDEKGLRFYSRVVKTSYAEDLEMLMEAGLIKQASFAFIVERDEWLIDEQGNILRTILEIAELFDVTVTAMGAYPQTDSQLVRSVVRGRAQGYAEEHGLLQRSSEPLWERRDSDGIGVAITQEENATTVEIDDATVVITRTEDDPETPVGDEPIAEDRTPSDDVAPADPPVGESQPDVALAPPGPAGGEETTPNEGLRALRERVRLVTSPPTPEGTDAREIT